MPTMEERYVNGEVDFETAAAEATGHSVERAELVPLLRALHQNAAAAELSVHDAALYDEAGFAESPVAAAAATIDHERRMRALTRSALTAAEAADLLGVSPARIRQRTTTGSLWALKVANKLLLPRVQFTADGVVPHIDKILAAVPRGLHPLSVEGLLDTPHAELAVDGRPASIVQWLRSGGDPVEALAVLEAFDRASV